MFDCHVHSKFSSDSTLDVEDACRKAEEAWLAGIAFTDHLDIDFPDSDDFTNIDFDYYSDFFDLVKEKHKSRLKVLKGIEVGIQPHVIAQSQAVVESQDFDYVLASVHILDGMDPYKKTYYEGKSKACAYERYLGEILTMVRNFKNYDIVGHFEYIIRCAGYDDRTMRYDDYSDVFDEILKILIHDGKGFEINTGSFRDIPGVPTASYDVSLLKRYRELGGEIVTLGSDAHCMEDIGYKFGYFREVLLSAGFSHEVHFENRKPVFEPL